MKFEARAKNGGLVFPSDYQRDQFRKYVKENDGIRLKIEPITPESNNQRAFFEGAIVPLVTYYQEGMDHRNNDHLRKIREWLKIEFNSEIVVVNKKACKVADSTKGKLNQGFIERVMDWMIDQGYQIDLLSTSSFKEWRDTIYPYSNEDNYIDYLLKINRLKNDKQNY